MVTTRYTSNDGVGLAYHLYSRWMFWRPRLVLIQGVGFDAGGWDPVLHRLRRDFRLVVLDNRGVGDSDPPSDWYTVATMVADVVAVLDAERIPAAHVLGVSLGGMVAQELAISHPERVKRLVLVSTTSGWPLTYPLPAPSRRMLATAPVLPRKTALRRQVTNMMSRKSIPYRGGASFGRKSVISQRKNPRRAIVDPEVPAKASAAGNGQSDDSAYCGDLAADPMPPPTVRSPRGCHKCRRPATGWSRPRRGVLSTG